MNKFFCLFFAVLNEFFIDSYQFYLRNFFDKERQVLIGDLVLKFEEFLGDLEFRIVIYGNLISGEGRGKLQIVIELYRTFRDEFRLLQAAILFELC
jgi:hypothetical protein